MRRTLRKKLNPTHRRRRIVQELKGSSTILTVKKYFYKQISSIDFSIYSYTLNKRRVYNHLIEDKPRIYNWIARLLLDKINFLCAQNKVTLILDKNKSRREIADFNKYVRMQLEAKINPNIPLEIRHLDSKADYCLNAADLFSWGIFRKYERRDQGWFDVFAEKIKFDDIYFPEK